MKEFNLTKEHIVLLRNAYVRWDDCEYGAPAIDSKYPYGDSMVLQSIAELLNVPYDEENGLDGATEDKLAKLHQETETALQIILKTGSFIPGVYVAKNHYDWELKNV